MVRRGLFEAAEQAFFWLYLRPGSRVIDCGAHVGLYTLLAYAACERNARIIAVEPNQCTAAILQENLSRNHVPEVEVVSAAVWSEEGSLPFLIGSSADSAFARVAFGQPGEVVVPSTTVDRLVREMGGGITLVKLDVEGAEPEALQGAEAATARGDCTVLMIEFTEANLQRRGKSCVELAREVSRLGYWLSRFSPESRRLEPFEVTGSVGYMNLFAALYPERVNTQLAEAEAWRVEIADDILARARECAPLIDLEQTLEPSRNVGGSRNWAERVEQALAKERETSESNQRWALQAEEALAKERETSESNRRWASQAEEALAKEREMSERNRDWALRAEEALEAERSKHRTPSS
ncbi:MAG TPA: FkbM family methyltransferase [Anaeromyxobacter sp.]|nr:FkbM family methyltransferase [Anaeromyxobacter sp.]